MGRITAILESAHQRAKERALPYRGALTATEAYELLQLAPNAKLVDVRTRAELDWVGYVSDDIDTVEIEWVTYPTMKMNPNFMAHLNEQVDKESLVLFLCRSGIRSYAAAASATQAGFPSCYNILEGFEGNRDTEHHRGVMGGWRAEGLPWAQD
jgi:rhodanese-related sulfurtransferase